jgi:hypothetical protein
MSVLRLASAGRMAGKILRLAVLAGEAAVAEVFGAAEGEQHAAEGQAHHGDDEREPASIGVRAVDADATEEEARCGGGEDADEERPEGALQQGASAVVW